MVGNGVYNVESKEMSAVIIVVVYSYRMGYVKDAVMSFSKFTAICCTISDPYVAQRYHVESLCYPYLSDCVVFPTTTHTDVLRNPIVNAHLLL